MEFKIGDIKDYALITAFVLYLIFIALPIMLIAATVAGTLMVAVSIFFAPLLAGAWILEVLFGI